MKEDRENGRMSYQMKVGGSCTSMHQARISDCSIAKKASMALHFLFQK